MMTITKAQGDAMARAVQESNDNPVYLRQCLRQAEEANAELRRLLHEARAQLAEQPARAQKVLQFNGRPIGTQSDLARALGTGAYNVNRWAKAGKLQTHSDGDRTWYFLDQSRPVGRKKSK